MIAVGSTNKMMVITGKRKARLRSTAGNIVQLRDITTGEKKTTLKLQTQKAASIAYSPDGNTIATGSTDGTVQFWDAITQEHKSTFTTHTDIVSVVYSPDGDTIATRSTDGTVLLWKIKPTSEAE